MLILSAIFLAQVLFYGILIWVLARLLAIYKPLTRQAIFLACLLVGLLSGLLTAWLWPRLDSILYPNIAGYVVGEEIYRLATSMVAAGTPSPHEAIAWPLRIPQVYVSSSIVLLGVAGAIVQTFYNRKNPDVSNSFDH